MSGVLIHIGFRKAGSTFIRDWFNSHPQLKTGGININAEFCRFESDNKWPEYFVLSGAFLLFKGDAPPRSIANLKKYQRETCVRLKELFPAAKILMITRSPETSITSEYSEYIKNGGTLTFNELTTNPEAIEYFIGYYDYNYTINLYCEAFGAENVIVLPFELLEDAPDFFIEKLEDQLGLERYNFPPHKRNPSIPYDKLMAFRRISIMIYKMAGMLGEKNKKYLTKKYTQYLERESYKNQKFSFVIKVISLFGKENTERIMPPAELINGIRKNADILKKFPLFEKYLIKYCLF